MALSHTPRGLIAQVDKIDSAVLSVLNTADAAMTAVQVTVALSESAVDQFAVRRSLKRVAVPIKLGGRYWWVAP